MDLTTTYLGLKLKNPIVPSASPLSRSIDTIRRLEDAGAAAVVLYSLFEEQSHLESLQREHYLEYQTEAFAEALTWMPEPDYRPSSDEYLEHIRRAKEAVAIPIIGSLNGISCGGWTQYAAGMQEAGADAIELNPYYVATEVRSTAEEAEARVLAITREVKGRVSIPVAVKISPFWSSMGHMATRLAEAGADALVLFNRFLQPDLDLDALEVTPRLVLSTSDELRLPLRWVAILYGRVPVDLAITTGVHTYQDVLKGLMAGARVTQMASELLQHGVGRIREILSGLQTWMAERGYASVAEMQGSMSQQNVADPAAFERANYMKVLHSWRPDPAGQLFRAMLP